MGAFNYFPNRSRYTSSASSAQLKARLTTFVSARASGTEGCPLIQHAATFSQKARSWAVMGLPLESFRSCIWSNNTAILEFYR